MPKGVCRDCGKQYYGWALIYRKGLNVCPECGGHIELVDGA